MSISGSCQNTYLICDVTDMVYCWFLRLSWFGLHHNVSIKCNTGLQCPITSETLLWILCSLRSNDIQEIWASVGPGSLWPKCWTTMFQNVKKNSPKFRLNVAWIGKNSNVKDFGDVTLAWEDEEQRRELIFENFKWKWKYHNGTLAWKKKMVWN